MCYSTDALPPFPPVGGGSGRGSVIDLTSADGTKFAAFSATTDAASAPGVVILPDVRGLHGFYQELALRFAEAGIHATAIDYFGRTAGVGTRDDSFDFMEHVRQTRPETVALDVTAALAHLSSPAGGSATQSFTMGFCFGGRNSFNQAGIQAGLSGAIGFYGRVGRTGDEDTTAPNDLAATYRCPVLGLFGGADPGIPEQDIELFETALTAGNVPHDIKVYESLPHSFFDRSFAEYAAECDDAWTRILDFIRH